MAGDGPAGGLVGRGGPYLEIRPKVFGHLGRQVPHAVGQTALAGRAREAALDRLDDARCPVRDHQQRIAQTSRTHVLQEGRHRLGVLLPAISESSTFLPSAVKPQAASTGSRR